MPFPTETKSLINSKIDAATTALREWFTNNTSHPSESNSYINKALVYFEDLKTNSSLSDDRKEYEVLCLLAGSLVIALVISQKHYPSDPSNKLPDTADPTKRYYPYTSQQILTGYVAQSTHKEEQIREMMFVGAKIISGSLPYDAEKMCKLFGRKLHYHLELIKDYDHKTILLPSAAEFATILNRRQLYFDAADDLSLSDNKRLGRAFERAVNACGIPLDNPRKEKFVNLIRELEELMVTSSGINYSGFTFNELWNLAEQVEKLAGKIGNNTLTETDCEEFKTQTHKFRNSVTYSAVINSIITTSAALLIGMTAGFVIASTAGMIIGGLGLFAIAGAVKVYNAKKEIDNHPLVQFTETSECLARSGRIF